MLNLQITVSTFRPRHAEHSLVVNIGPKIMILFNSLMHLLYFNVNTQLDPLLYQSSEKRCRKQMTYIFFFLDFAFYYLVFLNGRAGQL